MDSLVKTFSRRKKLIKLMILQQCLIIEINIFVLAVRGLIRPNII